MAWKINAMVICTKSSNLISLNAMKVIYTEIRRSEGPLNLKINQFCFEYYVTLSVHLKTNTYSSNA